MLEWTSILKLQSSFKEMALRAAEGPTQGWPSSLAPCLTPLHEFSGLQVWASDVAFYSSESQFCLQPEIPGRGFKILLSWVTLVQSEMLGSGPRHQQFSKLLRDSKYNSSWEALFWSSVFDVSEPTLWITSPVACGTLLEVRIRFGECTIDRGILNSADLCCRFSTAGISWIHRLHQSSQFTGIKN